MAGVKFLFAPLPPGKPPHRQRSERLPGTPGPLSFLISFPVNQPRPETSGPLEMPVSALVSIPASYYGSLAFPSIQTTPCERSREKDGSDPLSGPAQRKPGQPRWEQAASLSVSCKPHFLSSPSPYGFGNHRKCQALFSFFPTNTDTPWVYLSKDFPFPFLESHQGYARPFHHKGGWEEGGVSLVTLGRSK